MVKNKNETNKEMEITESPFFSPVGGQNKKVYDSSIDERVGKGNCSVVGEGVGSYLLPSKCQSST